MELTDAERAEFTALANDTFDPEIWDEADYPILKAARENYEKEKAQESGVLPDQLLALEDDEDREPEVLPHDEL